LDDPEDMLDGRVLSNDIDAIAIAPSIGFARSFVGDANLGHGFHPLLDIETESRIDLYASDALQKLHENMMKYVSGTPKNPYAGELRMRFEEHRELIDVYNQKNNRTGNSLQLWSYEGGVDLHLTQLRSIQKEEDGTEAIKYNQFLLDEEHNKEFADWLATHEKVIVDLYARYHRSESAGQLMSNVLELWDHVDGGLFCGYSSATKYTEPEYSDLGEVIGNKQGDFFGYMDLTDAKYTTTHKLKALLDRKVDE